MIIDNNNDNSYSPAIANSSSYNWYVNNGSGSFSKNSLNKMDAAAISVQLDKSTPPTCVRHPSEMIRKTKMKKWDRGWETMFLNNVSDPEDRVLPSLSYCFFKVFTLFLLTLVENNFGLSRSAPMRLIHPENNNNNNTGMRIETRWANAECYWSQSISYLCLDISLFGRSPLE